MGYDPDFIAAHQSPMAHLQTAQAGFIAGASSALPGVFGGNYVAPPMVRRDYGSLAQDGQALAQDAQRLLGGNCQPNSDPR